MKALTNPPTVEELFKGVKTLNDDDLFHFQIMVAKEQQLRLQSLKVGQLGMSRPHDHATPMEFMIFFPESVSMSWILPIVSTAQPFSSVAAKVRRMLISSRTRY